MNIRAPSADEQARKRRAAALWRADRQMLLISSPFLGVLAMRLELDAVIDDRVPTALTDGVSVFGHADFLLGLNDAERRFVLAHEIWHCALRHHARRGERQAHLWNVAVDQEVNDLLVQEGFQLPEGVVHEPAWRGLNAESVYERLLADASGGAVRRGRLADAHDDPVTGDGDAVHDPDFVTAFSAAVWRQWGEHVASALQQAACGTLPGSVFERLEASRRPRVPWRRVLHRFVRQRACGGFRWDRPARRHWGRGQYLPSRRSPHLDLTVAIDTSGSTHAEWPVFLGELRGILTSFRSYAVRMLQFDRGIHSDRLHTPRHPIPRSMDLGGGGGTDIRQPFHHLEGESTNALVILTDGMGPAPSGAPPYPVLWVLPAQGRQPVTWGEAIQLPGTAACLTRSRRAWERPPA